MPGSAFRPPSPATPTSAGCADRPVPGTGRLRQLRPARSRNSTPNTICAPETPPAAVLPAGTLPASEMR